MMNTISSTDAKSNRSGSLQDTDTTILISPQSLQKCTSPTRTSISNSSHQYSSSVKLSTDDCFINEDASSSTPTPNHYYQSTSLLSCDDKQYDDNGMYQRQQTQYVRQQQQQHQRQYQPLPSHSQQHLLQDSERDVSSLEHSLRYHGRQGPLIQTQGPMTLHNHLHTQTQKPLNQFLHQEHQLSYEVKNHDQQSYQTGLRFNDASRMRRQTYRPHLPSHNQQESIDDDDNNDLDEYLEQGPRRTLEVINPSQKYNNAATTLQRPPRPNSLYEVHSNNFITEDEFLILADDYLLSLSPKKREKALLTNAMYQKILIVLLQPKNTQVSTAQFRFWAKKMFTLSTTETHHIVCHSGKPVATKECLYDVLVYCHRKSSHGGRDKTSAEVRQHYSWVPKELIARFVKHCPLCSSRRHSLQRSLSGTLPDVGFGLFAPSESDGPDDQQQYFSTSSDQTSGRSSQLEQYLIDPNQAAQDDTPYLNSPQGTTPKPSSTTMSDRGLQNSFVPSQLQQGARLHSEHMTQLLHQRMQTEGSVGRYYDNRPHLRSHGHLRPLSMPSYEVSGSTQSISRDEGGFVHPDSSGIGPPGNRNEEFPTMFSDGLRRHSWGRDSHMTFDVNQDTEMIDERYDYDHNENNNGLSAIKRGLHNDAELLQIRGEGYDTKIIQDEKDDDYTPSGLVGVLQEIRRPGPIGTLYRNSQSIPHNRQFSQQHQQHGAEGLTQYLSGQIHHSADQEPSASPGMSSALSQHTGAPSNRITSQGRLAMGYPYGYPYPHNPASSSGAMVYGSLTKGHGTFQPSTQQQQRRQTVISHSTSAMFQQMTAGPLNSFPEMRDYATKEAQQNNQIVHPRRKSGGGEAQGQPFETQDSLT